MKCLIFLALFVSAYCEVTEEDDVLVVTAENWDEAVSNDKDVLVEFYAPWCGHCKKLTPEFAAAAKQFKDDGVETKLAKVDCTIEKSLAQKYGIKGFPTLKFFKKGNMMDYDGGRVKDQIISWLNKKTGPPAKTLETAEDVKKFAESHDVVVLGFFASKESKLATEFLHVAEALVDIEFGISTPDVSGDLDVKGDKIVVVKKFDNLRADYEGEVNLVEIRQFVQAETTPLVLELTGQNQKQVFGGDIRIHVFLSLSKKSEEYEEPLAIFTEVAKTYKGVMKFVLLNTEEAAAIRIMDYLNIKRPYTPTLRILKQVSGPEKFQLPEGTELTKASIEGFIKSFIDGKLEQFYKSAEVPSDWNENPVKVLVGKNFEAVAASADFDAFVEFYAPWCGHCKTLAPIWEELAVSVKDHPSLIIAKMDSTENEVKGVQIQSFPTIKYFPKEGPTIDYTGGRTLEEFKKFLTEQGVLSGSDATPLEEPAQETTKEEPTEQVKETTEEGKEPTDEKKKDTRGKRVGL